MDLIAYAQKDDLEHILKELGIEVPRLRGLDLMFSNEPYTAEEIKDAQKEYTEYEYRCRDEIVEREGAERMRS